MSTDATEQGRLAFRNNFPMSSCQYPVGSSLRAAWMSGWTEARNAAPESSAGHPGMMKDARTAVNLDRIDAPHES